MERVSGIDAVIPWEMLHVEGVEVLQDMAQLTQVGISLPIAAFEVGVEEFQMHFVGDTFSFSVALSEEGVLGMLHEACQMQHVVIREPEKRMPIGTGFSGVRLLDMFLHQRLQQHSVGAESSSRALSVRFLWPERTGNTFLSGRARRVSRSPEWTIAASKSRQRSVTLVRPSRRQRKQSEQTLKSRLAT